jgi:hypothetical protein
VFWKSNYAAEWCASALPVVPIRTALAKTNDSLFMIVFSSMSLAA